MTAETAANLDFEAYVRNVGPDLLSFFARRVYPPDDSADLVAETMVVLWRRRSAVPLDRDAARAWAFGVARGVLRNYRRSGARRLALADAIREQLATVRPDAPGQDGMELAAALSTLRDADRELVLLVAWEGLTLELAAVVLGITAPSARARYSRARAKLREALA